MHDPSHATPDFSLLAGGPAHLLQQRLGLVKPGDFGLWRRVIIFVLLTWVPIAVISLVEGTAYGHGVRLPFFADFAAYARFLVAIPLLILSEGVVERRVSEAIAHFIQSGIVPSTDRGRFNATLSHCRALRDSTVAELLILGVAVLGAVLVSNEFPFDFTTWRSAFTGSVHTRTLAGWWYLAVGCILFQFLVWRWVWRLLIWYRLLWTMSRLELRLIPTHPDRSGGLGMVGETQRSFWAIVFAISATTAGVLANEIVYGGVPLKNYEFSIGGYAVLILIVFLAPLLMFTPTLVEAKDEGLRQYGALAVAHHHMFHRKWVHGENPAGDPVLGTPEISSLADLGAAYDILSEMRATPFEPEDAVVLLLAALAPMAPLLLTIMPIGELLEMMSKLLV